MSDNTESEIKRSHPEEEHKSEKVEENATPNRSKENLCKDQGKISIVEIENNEAMSKPKIQKKNPTFIKGLGKVLRKYDKLLTNIKCEQLQSEIDNGASTTNLKLPNFAELKDDLINQVEQSEKKIQEQKAKKIEHRNSLVSFDQIDAY